MRVLGHEEVQSVLGVQGEDAGEANALAPGDEGVHVKNRARFLLDGQQLAPELRAAPCCAELLHAEVGRQFVLLQLQKLDLFLQRRLVYCNRVHNVAKERGRLVDVEGRVGAPRKKLQAPVVGIVHLVLAEEPLYAVLGGDEVGVLQQENLAGKIRVHANGLEVGLYPMELRFRAGDSGELHVAEDLDPVHRVQLGQAPLHVVPVDELGGGVQLPE